MHTTSVSLLERLARDGENSDWQRLITIYRPFIQRQVCGYPSLADQADDVAQEVMMVLMRELPVFQRQRTGSFRTWLRGITLNQLRMAIRKAKRQPIAAGNHVSLEEQIEQLADPVSLASKKWDEEHDKTVFKRVSEIVKNDVLPTTWLAFERYALANEPVTKVADELGISVNSVLLAKSRITRRLREEVAGLVDQP